MSERYLAIFIPPKTTDRQEEKLREIASLETCKSLVEFLIKRQIIDSTSQAILTWGFRDDTSMERELILHIDSVRWSDDDLELLKEKAAILRDRHEVSVGLTQKSLHFL